ncbi:fimbrial subunit FimA [Moraxella macacae 0408225]|uniref:Fimbrial subunit FimA n=1 Tax=Moraxella macacae 0408225 TaxID=1230338 RepID=L2F6B3_9GAMM|nr:pilin [Moraxella macacae]ELA07993.1 fimbrial subunit FimA [Moraxella macacae 0408225]
MGLFVYGLISILAAIAIPAYQDYIAKSQVSEAFTLADGLKTTIATNRQNGSCFADTKKAASGTEELTGKYGKAVVLEQKPSGSTGLVCGIHYTFNKTGVSDLIAGKEIVLKLDETDGTLKLATSAGNQVSSKASSIDTKYVPNAFK